MESNQTSAQNWLPDSVRVSLLITRVFEELDIAYLIGGSMASIIHGKPRLTNDVDLVANIKEHQVSALVAALQEEFYIDEMAIRRAIRERSMFNILYLETMFKADIYIWRGDAWAREQMRQRQAERLIEDDESTIRQVSNAETTVLQKLWWFRRGGKVSEKQWSDILGVLEVKSNSLDYDYLKHWAAELGVADLLVRAFDDAGIVSSTTDP